MSDSEILLRAVINRIAARLTNKVINSAEELVENAQEVPQKLKDEWSSFKEEVLEESKRLEKTGIQTNTAEKQDIEGNATKEDMLQIKIDNLRSKVIEINKNIEEKN